MICALLFVNQKGEVIISRHYRDGFNKGVADTFRTQVIAGKEVRCLSTHCCRLALAFPVLKKNRGPANALLRSPPGTGSRSRVSAPFTVACRPSSAAAAPQANRTPCKVIGNTAFLYIKVGNMYAVAISQGNAQAAVAFQFLHEVIKVLKAYFGDFTEER